MPVDRDSKGRSRAECEFCQEQYWTKQGCEVAHLAKTAGHGITLTRTCLCTAIWELSSGFRSPIAVILCINRGSVRTLNSLMPKHSPLISHTICCLRFCMAMILIDKYVRYCLQETVCVTFFYFVWHDCATLQVLFYVWRCKQYESCVQ